jgi:hypothetical protein
MVVDWHVIALVNILVGQSYPHFGCVAFLIWSRVPVTRTAKSGDRGAPLIFVVALPSTKAPNNTLASLRLALRMDSVSIEEWR